MKIKLNKHRFIGGFGGGGVPPVPGVPSPPLPAEAASNVQRANLNKRPKTGLLNTILTSGLGDSSVAPVSKKSLLGS